MNSNVYVLIAIAVVALGVGLYERRRTKPERSKALYHWMVIVAGGMIAFLILGLTVEDWYFLWFWFLAGILVLLLGVGAVFRWRRPTGH